MTEAKYHAFRTEERKTLTDQQRAKLFLDRGGKCHRCTRKIRPGEKWYDEHIIALENGGTNDWDNRGISCHWCFPKKNKDDDAIAAKTREIAVGHIIPREQRKSKWRPMPGGKKSGIRIKMDRTIEKR